MRVAVLVANVAFVCNLCYFGDSLNLPTCPFFSSCTDEFFFTWCEMLFQITFSPRAIKCKVFPRCCVYADSLHVLFAGSFVA